MSVLIRLATLDDVPALCTWNAAMAWETERKPLDPARLQRGVAGVFAQAGRGFYLIAERDGVAVGSLLLTYEWSDWRCADWWWIQSVYVAPGARRIGVFQALYRHVHGLAANTERVCGLRLYVEHSNHGAQRTYAALGMQDSGYQMLEATMPWVQQIVKQEQ